jgi:LacI family transcriptional regulator
MPLPYGRISPKHWRVKPKGTRTTDRTSGPSLPRMALMIGTWNEYGRGIIEGVWQYAQQHGPWLLEMEPSEPDENVNVPRGWSGSGIIASVQTQRLETKLKALGVPVVNVSGSLRASDHFPRVTTDAAAVVKMAVTHLLEKRLNHIAFCGEPHRPFLGFWADAFTTVMRGMDKEVLIYQPSARIGRASGLEAHRNDRRRWIESLPKPVGIVGWATDICRHIAIACTDSGLKVPEDVAIISLETEDLLARVVHPPISGVDIPVKRIGYEAAAMLDRMMRGERPDTGEIRLPPLGVTARQSTDLVACDDSHVRQALAFVRERFPEGIDVRDVLKAVPMARRSLERRFFAIVGRTPAEEIRRVRIEKVRQLLDSSSLPVAAIAEACGFNYVEHMIPVFRKYYGCTPTGYRRTSGQGGKPNRDNPA